MRRRDDTLPDTLLSCARSLAQEQGIGAINIRSLAQLAQVSVGTVYNYFSNKEEILLALTQEYWHTALLELDATLSPGPFSQQLVEIFQFLKSRVDRFAGVLMRSLGEAQGDGQQHMAGMQATLERLILQRMEQDGQIRGDIWDATFSKAQYAHFVVGHLTAQLRCGAPELDFFLALVKRTLY